MTWISVPRAAERLGVSEGRVRQRITNGSLPAEWVGRQWIIDERDLAGVGDRSDPGRPLSCRSAWAVIVLAHALATETGDDAAPRWLSALSAQDRSRARRRLHGLLAHHQGATNDHQAADAAAAVRLLLGGRGERVLFRASARDLPDLIVDHRVSRSGLSNPYSGIAAGGLLEAYVAVGDLPVVVDDYLLDQAKRDDAANVVFHVVSEDLSEHAHAVLSAEPMVQLLLAADLAEHRRPREQARAAHLVDELALFLNIPAVNRDGGDG